MFDIWNQRVLLDEEAYHSDNCIIQYNNAVNNNECVISILKWIERETDGDIWLPLREPGLRQNWYLLFRHSFT